MRPHLACLQIRLKTIFISLFNGLVAQPGQSTGLLSKLFFRKEKVCWLKRNYNSRVEEIQVSRVQIPSGPFYSIVLYTHLYNQYPNKSPNHNRTNIVAANFRRQKENRNIYNSHNNDRISLLQSSQYCTCHKI